MVALTAASTACVPEGVTRAGGPQPAVVLDVLVADAPGRFTDEVAGELAAGVESATDGRVVLELVRLEDDARRWNQEVAHAVMDGTSDFGIVPAQAWDAVGVESFTALYAPFAVTTDELIDAIAQDSLADDMLGELDTLGVTGLALVPGGVRTMFQADEPLAGPDTYRGKGVRVAYSRAVWAYYEALGAHPDDPNGDESYRLQASGAIAGLDAQFRFADNFVDRPAAAVDTISHPHALTIVVNTDRFASLPDSQREGIRRAARMVVEWSATTRRPAEDEAAALCARAPGSTLVLAGPAAVEALRATAQTVVADLLDDPEVAGFARRIADLDARLGHPSLRIRPCSGAELPAAGRAPPNVPAEFPGGFYRREVTLDELVAAGVDESTAALHAGVVSLEFRDGGMIDGECPGSSYAIVEDRLVITMGTGPGCGTATGKVLFSAGWRLQGDQMTFTNVESGHGSDVLIRALFGGGSWTKLR